MAQYLRYHGYTLSLAFILLIECLAIMGSSFSSNLSAAGSEIYRDVCVIGGGAAGTYAAIGLLARNQTILVVENTASLGGHADVYTDPLTGSQITVGVKKFTNTPIVQAYYSRLGVAAVPAPPSSNNSTNRVYFDFEAGVLDNSFVPPDKKTLDADFARYANHFKLDFPFLQQDGYNLPSPIPEDLLLPIGTFAKKYGHDSIVYPINTYTLPNYILNETALYTLRLFDLNYLAEITQSNGISVSNVGQLYTNAAEIIGNDNLLFNSTVSELSRSPHGVTLTVSSPTGPQTIHAKKLLMAAPPVLSNLKGWDLSTEEKALFGSFQSYGAAAGLFRHAGIPNNTIISAVGSNTPFNIPELPGIIIINPIDPLPDTFQVIFQSAEPLSGDASKEIFLEQLERLVVASNWTRAETEVDAWYNHSPLKLHVDAEKIRGGFYQELNALQGRDGTWWTGGAWAAQVAAPIWAFTDGLLDRMMNVTE